MCFALNFSYNPFIYCSLNSTFRNEAKKLLPFMKNFRLLNKPRVNDPHSINSSNQIGPSSLINGGMELQPVCAENTDNIRLSTTNNQSPKNLNNRFVNAVVHQNCSDWTSMLKRIEPMNRCFYCQIILSSMCFVPVPLVLQL